MVQRKGPAVRYLKRSRLSNSESTGRAYKPLAPTYSWLAAVPSGVLVNHPDFHCFFSTLKTLTVTFQVSSSPTLLSLLGPRATPWIAVPGSGLRYYDSQTTPPHPGKLIVLASGQCTAQPLCCPVGQLVPMLASRVPVPKGQRKLSWVVPKYGTPPNKCMGKARASLPCTASLRRVGE